MLFAYFLFALVHYYISYATKNQDIKEKNNIKVTNNKKMNGLKTFNSLKNLNPSETLTKLSTNIATLFKSKETPFKFKTQWFNKALLFQLNKETWSLANLYNILDNR